MKDSKPRVMTVVLDIDGTMIGDISSQIMLYQLQNDLKKTSKVKIFDLNKFRKTLNEKNIIRPYLKKFLSMLTTHFNNIGCVVEYFVYTASEKTWAYFLISQLEKVLNIKLNRPLLTRQECDLTGTYQKSKSLASSICFKTLKKKYNYLKKEDIDNNLLIIDNTYEIFNDIDKQHLIYCPTYNGKYTENLPSLINETTFELLQKNLSFSSYYDFESTFYKFYVKEKYLERKQNQKKDIFFKKLIKIIIKLDIQDLSIKNISLIKTQLEKHKDTQNLKM